MNRSGERVMALAKLLGAMEFPKAYQDLPLRGLCQDSRQVESGDLFFALSGSKNSGLNFIDEAVKRGASAIAVDKRLYESIPYPPVPLIPLDNLSEILAGLASKFYGNPSERLHISAVTGTNGKTSCCWLISELVNQLGAKTGYIGTLGHGTRAAELTFNGSIRETTLTTPDSISLQKILADFEEQGVEMVALEASSHALAQGRLDGVDIDDAVFTNLSRDHLDYHLDMASYGEAKALLFEKPGVNFSVLNLDDAFSQKLIKKTELGAELLTYSLDNTSADIYCRDIKLDVQGLNAQVVSPWGEGQLQSPLIGQFNLANLLSVIATVGTRYPFSEVLSKLPMLKSPAGRMELINAEAKPGVIVDYAHTPDALEKVLITLRSHGRGKLWVVFGCGGERDIGKRSKMGAIAERYADYVVITNDNPRGESEEAIISHIKMGMIGKVVVEMDRRSAIRHAISHASPDDLILIAGKGHEEYQQLSHQTFAFSDQTQAKLALNDLTGAGL